MRIRYRLTESGRDKERVEVIEREIERENEFMREKEKERDL